MRATITKTITCGNWSWLGLACCFVCLAAVAQAADTSSSSSSTATTTRAMPKDATHLYKIKRQDKYQQQQLHLQLQQLQGQAALPVKKQKQKQLTRGAHGSNKKLLSKMGFMKVKAPNSHNRKRLAVESRRHASRDDSHMFIIKLPPNMHYYANPNTRNALEMPATTKLQSQSYKDNDNAQKLFPAAAAAAAAETEASALKANGKKVSFPFSSNGRPGRIYHWNLPVLKQAMQKKPHFAHVSAEDRNRLLDIENIPTWRKPWENETIEKSFAPGAGDAGGKSKYRKSLKQKSPTYYAPAQAVNKQSFHKYFAGNGKPKGFYVIKEHQAKPQFYQNIIS